MATGSNGSSSARIYQVFSLALLLLAPQSTNAHGWIITPPSRQESCRNGTVPSSGCGGVQYEPQSVEAPKGGPFDLDLGDHICNGDASRFDALNTPAIWPSTTVPANQDLALNWTMTVVHRTTKWEYFLTKPNVSANQTSRLTKDDFLQTPVLTVQGNDTVPPYTLIHTVPADALQNRTGSAVMLGVWTIGDTANAFYSCVDLAFSGVNQTQAVNSTQVRNTTFSERRVRRGKRRADLMW